MASSINASTTAGVVTTADTSGVLNIQTAGTTAISIDASQAVSFTNPITGALNGTIGATTPATGAFTTVSAAGKISALWSISTGDGMLVRDTGNTSGASFLAFQNSSGGYIGYISRDALTNNMQLKQVSGITFPATQSASSNANTLDDYEEGTWSPTVEGTTTAGTVTYASRSGKYTKVGNVVTFSAYIGWSSGSGTGNLQIAGFPFAPTGTTYPAITTIANELTLTALNIAVAYISDSTTAALIQQCPAGGGTKTNVAYDAAVSELFLAGVYQTAT